MSAFTKISRLISPVAVLFLSLLFLYTILPNARVKLRSAALGALIGSLAWYLALIVHVRFQVGVARFNALYSGFAAFPTFLAWLHISWLIVLVGAIIPGCRMFEKRWESLSDSEAANPELAGRFRRDRALVWAFALGLPFALTGLFLGIAALL